MLKRLYIPLLVLLSPLPLFN